MECREKQVWDGRWGSLWASWVWYAGDTERWELDENVLKWH